jgi:hypothetical protein
MHGSKNVKFANAHQTKQTYQERKMKEKLYNSTAAIWYNRGCRQKQLTPNYTGISIKVKRNNCQCLKTIQAATHRLLNQELKFRYIKKQKLNETGSTLFDLVMLHLLK